MDYSGLRNLAEHYKVGASNDEIVNNGHEVWSKVMNILMPPDKDDEETKLLKRTYSLSCVMR